MKYDKYSELFHEFQNQILQRHPALKEDLNTLACCLYEIIEYMILLKDTNKEIKTDVPFASVVNMAEYILEKDKAKDIDSLTVEALTYIRIHLFDIFNNANLARKVIGKIIRNIEKEPEKSLKTNVNTSKMKPS